MDTHPGTAAMDALRTRQPPRPREVIEKEKADKAATKQAKVAAQERKAAGEKCVAELEVEEAAAAVVEENDIPRRKGNLPFCV